MIYAVNNDIAQGASEEISGLPDSRSAGPVIALFQNGHGIALGDRHGLTLYGLEAGPRGARSARVLARHRIEGRVLDIEASPLGLVVAVAREAGSDLLLVNGDVAVALTTLDGEVTRLCVVGASVIVALKLVGRRHGRLACIDLRQREITAERALPNVGVDLAADPGGQRLLIVDPEAGRVEILGPDLTTDGVGRAQEGDSGALADGGGLICGHGGRITLGARPVAGDGARGIDLLWPIAKLKRAGRFVLALDAAHRHAALLTADELRLLTEWQFGRVGASLVTLRDQPLMLVRSLGRDGWTLVDLQRLALAAGHSFDRGALITVSEKTFIGTAAPAPIDGHAPTRDTLKTLILPVIEGDQVFASANLDGVAAYLERAMVPVVRDYHAENSYGQLGDLRFSIFGATLGPKAGPLRLPRARLADYHFPAYEPARVELVKNGVTAGTPIVLDGRESLALEARPLDGGPQGGTLNVPFFALAFEQSHDRFPVRIRFLGIEHVHLNVTTPAGVIHALDLVFPARTIEFHAHDIAARLDELAIYLEGVFQTAELSAGVASRIFARPKVQRLPETGRQFGRLVTTVVGALANGPKLVINAVTAVGVGADDPLGVTNAVPGMIFAGSDGLLARYLGLVLMLAQEGAGFDFTRRPLGPPTVVHEPSTSRLTVRLPIADRFGGPGAELKVAASSGLHALFDLAEAKPNSASTRDRARGLRDGEALFADAFSAAAERLRAAGLPVALLEGFDCALVLPIEPALPAPGDVAAVQPGEAWSVSPPARPVRLMGAAARLTVVDRADPALRLRSAWSLVFFDGGKPDNAAICHTLGHAIGFRALGRLDGFSTDLAYLESWAMMDRPSGLPHHAGYHKLQAGWIPEGLGTESDHGRVLPIAPAAPDEVKSVELLLVPIELWRDGLVARARAAFGLGDGIPVVQLVRLDLGGDGGAFDLIEARQLGARFPLAGSAAAANVSTPGVIITSAIAWSDDRRHEASGSYRRPLHLVNPNPILRQAGDRIDLDQAPALAVKGAIVELIETRLVDGDAHVFHLRVTRRNAAFVDLYFSNAEPRFRNPDLWLDFIGDNGSDRPEDHRVYPPGMPLDLGEPIRVHPMRETAHWLVARLRNRGTTSAQGVRLAFKIADPPGGGDPGANYRTIGSITVPEVKGGDQPITVPVRWSVPGGFPGRGGLLVEIEDYRIAAEAAGAGSGEAWSVNRHAEKSVDMVEALRRGDGFAPIEFDFSVHNGARVPELAYVEPEGLPEGMSLTVSPVSQHVPAGQSVIFRCRLALDPAVIAVGAENDRRFRLIAWRQDPESAARWGGVEYSVRPRTASAVSLTGYWNYGDDIALSGQVTPNPGGGIVQLRLDFEGQPTLWTATAVSPAGSFSWRGRPSGGARLLEAMAWFRGDDTLGSARSAALGLRAPSPASGPSRVG